MAAEPSGVGADSLSSMDTRIENAAIYFQRIRMQRTRDIELQGGNARLVVPLTMWR